MVKVLEDFSIGLKKTGLVIRDTALLAEGFDDLLCFSQFVARDNRQQVVLDLIIQSTIPEISNRMCPDVARTQYLLMQKVQLVLFIRNEHAFMIGCSH